MKLLYCAWDADKNKQQLGLQEFLFGISMTQKKQKIDNKKYFQQATTHSQKGWKKTYVF